MDAIGVSSPRANVCTEVPARDLLCARAVIEAWCAEPRSTQCASEVEEIARAAPAVAIAAGLAKAVAAAPDAPATKRVVRKLDDASYAALRRELLARGLDSDTFAQWFDDKPYTCQWARADEEETVRGALEAVRAMEEGEECVRAMEAMLTNALRELGSLDARLDTVGLYLTP